MNKSAKKSKKSILACCRLKIATESAIIIGSPKKILSKKQQIYGQSHTDFDRTHVNLSIHVGVVF